MFYSTGAARSRGEFIRRGEKNTKKRKSAKRSRASFDVRKFTGDVTDSSSSDKSDSDEITDLSGNEECFPYSQFITLIESYC